MIKVKTRFAPSPTGALHIGSLRTALYAYALAKKEDGVFLLRIEDTDKKREVEGSTEEIKKILGIFRIGWDEFYLQSDRVKTGVYQKAAERLVADGHAFYCECAAKNAKKEGFSSQLRDPCRDKNLTRGAIKLKVPDGKSVSFTDFVLGKEISWDTSTVADTTLLKSDGFPTYHLAVVVDDTESGITHVLRGHDWMPSTPIHLLVYEYLGYKRPEIGHLTDILDPKGGKLSKRKGSTSCVGLLAEGYLPEAILNFIMLLGWAPKDNQEIFSLESFVKAFDHNGFQKSNPVFNREKLDWFNGYYIRETSDEKLTEILCQFLEEKYSKETIAKTVPLVKERIVKLTDYLPLAEFFFAAKKADPSLFGPNKEKHLKVALETLKSIQVWGKEEIDTKLIEKVKENEFKTGDFFMDLRVAITGVKFTPPINDSIVILGKEESVKRIEDSLNL